MSILSSAICRRAFWAPAGVQPAVRDVLAGAGFAAARLFHIPSSCNTQNTSQTHVAYVKREWRLPRSHLFAVLLVSSSVAHASVHHACCLQATGTV